MLKILWLCFFCGFNVEVNKQLHPHETQLAAGVMYSTSPSITNLVNMTFYK